MEHGIALARQGNEWRQRVLGSDGGTPVQRHMTEHLGMGVSPTARFPLPDRRLFPGKDIPARDRPTSLGGWEEVRALAEHPVDGSRIQRMRMRYAFEPFNQTLEQELPQSMMDRLGVASTIGGVAALILYFL